MWPGDALPQHGNTNWQVFYATRSRGEPSTAGFQTYMKPPGASMIYILMIAAGAGGSRVADGNVTTAGGGGGSGGMSRMLIPAGLLPDIIYVSVGRGGLGATTANTIGAAGADSFVLMSRENNSSSVILRQNGAAQAASTQAAGPGGVIGDPTSNSVFASLGLWFSIAGQAGTAGSATANAAATDITPGGSGIITTGGGGGANGTGGTGDITASGFFPAISSNFFAGRIGHGFQKGAIISPGLKSFPLIFTGGGGGYGLFVSGNCANGGAAGYGGGGGGGGSGTNAGSISGNGGNGGDGLIIIGSL